ncbi:hypothetical protein A7982_13998 [Minicystis rosea]|nr:hypothetical protein A7982_13998 [Minicystis rosea]
MESCADRTFTEVWSSIEAERVRNARYPACYDIEAPSGARLADDLKDGFVPAARLLRAAPSGARSRVPRQRTP